MRRGWLTPYQVNQLFRPDGRPLLVGSYVLLDKLGEGGMGAVYKARNWKLGRVVALKLIRRERLASPDAVRRFQREVRAAAALDHPNVVHALDADEIGGTQRPERSGRPVGRGRSAAASGAATSCRTRLGQRSYRGASVRGTGGLAEDRTGDAAEDPGRRRASASFSGRGATGVRACRRASDLIRSRATR